MCSSIEQYIGEKSVMAAQMAKKAHQEGRRANLRTVLWRAPWKFFQSYVLRSGWRDGWAGFHACFLTALQIYLREMMLWDMKLTASEDSSHRRQLSRAA